MTNVKVVLENRFKKVNKHIKSVLSTIEDYANNSPILAWLNLKYVIDAKKLPPPDPGHYRRLNCVYNRVKESLESLTIDKLRDDKIPEFSRFVKKPKDILKKYEDKFKVFAKKNNEVVTQPFCLADVVRRLKDGSELAPLLVSSLDPELFTACYVHRCLDSHLLPEERLILYKRIWRDVYQYVTGQRQYYDLSTLWWAVRIVTHPGTTTLEDDTPKEDGTPKLNEKIIEVVRLVLEKSLEPEGVSLDERLLRKGWKRYTSRDRDGDLITPRRSLVFCHQNAIAVRIWLEERHDPALLPLIETIRDWADSCANHWLDGLDHKDLRLYDAALDLAFCREWWKDRLSCAEEAMKILDNGVKDKNLSKIKGIATTNEAFAEQLNQVNEDVCNFRKTPKQERPLVVGLFGPPGTGKSAVAKAIDEDEEFLIELNLAACETPKELFTTLSDRLNKSKNKDGTIMFLDEFDTRLANEFWYRWLLTLLWDGKFPVVQTPNLIKDITLPNLVVVFLAASRYETFEDFRDFALSQKAKDHKAADLLTRIDMHLDLLRLEPPDRALVVESIAKKYEGHADRELIALCYMAELEDNARGIRKLLKGVNLKSNFGLSDLTLAAREHLIKTAGLAGQLIA